MELHLFIDPNTLEVTEERCRRCTDCRRVRPFFRFKEAVRGNVTARCSDCYDDYYERRNKKIRSMALREKISVCVRRANRRSRYRRSKGEDLDVEEAMAKWSGSCSNCHRSLTFEWWPRPNPNDDLAIIDRVNTEENSTYHENMAWLCNACNTEKSGYDLCRQLRKEICELKARLHGKRAIIDYESILIPSGRAAIGCRVPARKERKRVMKK